MKLTRSLAMAAAAALLVSTGAWAAGSCTGFGKFGPPREVAGVVLEIQRDSLGISHVVVKDDSTGCRVSVLASEKSVCTSGKHFEAFGRLRSDFKGSDYDATLDAGRSGGKCL